MILGIIENHEAGLASFGETMVLVGQECDEESLSETNRLHMQIIARKMMYRSLALVIMLVYFSVNLFAQGDESYHQLIQTFNQCTHIYPADSVSLSTLYFQQQKSRDSVSNAERIVRLRELCSDRIQTRYRDVERNLRPLLVTIVKKNAATKAQVKKIISLYSAYDYLRGEGLLSRVLSDEDNYQLVWKSLGILAKEARKDTIFISALIELSDTIGANVELSESMSDFVLTSIHNNTIGFLQMYANRDSIWQSKILAVINPEGVSDEKVSRNLKGIARLPGHGRISSTAKTILKQLKMKNKS